MKYNLEELRASLRFIERHGIKDKKGERVSQAIRWDSFYHDREAKLFYHPYISEREALWRMTNETEPT